ncbi:PdxT/SNO family [Gautieria morchelliformis]|nr:PdxT/SNO family [Gautieria morchelliformis]
MGREAVTIGVLALQGAFAEHHSILSRLHISQTSVTATLVKTPDDLARCDALIIPGGESTTIALLARLAGLLEPLRAFVKRKPVWGTCAGAILLAEGVQGAKKGGQELLGGVSVILERNGWGSQVVYRLRAFAGGASNVESFEALMDVDVLKDPRRPFTGVFIRAPVVLNYVTDETRPPIEVLARLSPALLPRSEPGARDGPLDQRTVVAFRQGHHLVTMFHPELTRDDRFHEYFVRTCVSKLEAS